jgi:DNA-binding protein HU-beta
MNKQDLISAVSSSLDGSTANVEETVNLAFNCIAAALRRGDDVRITGFGVFKRVATKARTCHNPRTGGAIEVAAGFRAKFRASSKLLEG